MNLQMIKQRMQYGILKIQSGMSNNKGMSTIEVLLIIAAVVVVGLAFRTQVVATTNSFLTAFNTYMGTQETTVFGGGN